MNGDEGSSKYEDETTHSRAVMTQDYRTDPTFKKVDDTRRIVRAHAY
jgi:hypothetical protein